MPQLDTYFVRLRIRAGDHEKQSNRLVRASSEELAKNYAIYCEAHAPASLDWTDGGAYDCGGEFFYSVDQCRVLTGSQCGGLRGFVPVHTACAIELANEGNYPHAN